MSKPETVVEEAATPVTASANVNGAPLPPFEPERARATLEWLRRQTPEGQRATFEYWQHALNETRAAHGDSPRESFASSETVTQTNVYGAPLPPFNPARVMAALDWLCQQDPAEQRETYEHLKRALNETRAANGERLVFAEDTDAVSNATRQVLAQLDDFDVEEQRETFEHLQQALRESLQTDQTTLPAPELAAPESPNHSGAPLLPYDSARAIEALRVLRQGDPEEHRKTFEVLERMEREKQKARRLAIPGVAFEPIDIEEAYRLLDQLDEFDPAEQRETFEYLREALNAERAAGGERLLFP